MAGSTSVVVRHAAHRLASYGQRLAHERRGARRLEDALLRNTQICKSTGRSGKVNAHLLRLPGWPAGAARRWPTPRPGALPTSPHTPSARRRGDPAPRALREASQPHRRAPRPAPGPRARAGRPAAVLKLSVRLPMDLIAALVHSAMVPPTEQGEVRERGRPALRPVTQVMALGEPHPAPRKATAAVPVLQRAPQRRGDRSRARSDLHDLPGRVVPHDHPARVARQTPRRFCGNAYAVLQHRLAGLVGVGEHGRVDVDHDLIPLACGARIQLVP